MRQLQLIAHGEPSDVIELNTVSEPALGQEDVLISMEAAPLNPSDFLFVRGTDGVRPAFPSSVGAEGVGRVAKIGSKVDVALRGKRVLIIPTYEQGTWADQVVAPVRNLVPMSDEADPLQLAMIGINPVTASLAEPIRFPDARRLDRSNRSQCGHGTVHHCTREAGRSQDAECRPAGRSCRTGAAVGR
jgi:NADPH:quinone reductase-like Zn-dependent oxidoreductase